MASLIPRPCTQPYCGVLVKGGGRCPKHQAKWQEEDNARHMSKYGKGAARGYDSEWRRVRDRVIASQPLCACGAPSRLVHHRVPLRHGGARLDEGNLVALCHACHERTHKGK